MVNRTNQMLTNFCQFRSPDVIWGDGCSGHTSSEHTKCSGTILYSEHLCLIHTCKMYRSWMYRTSMYRFPIYFLTKRPRKKLKNVGIYDFNFPGNWFEFGIILINFWSFTIWAIQIQSFVNWVPKSYESQTFNLII